MAVDVFGELRSQVRSAALDHTLDPGDRYARLTTLRERMSDVLGELDRYRSDAQRIREAASSSQAREVLWARANADVREELLELGEFTAATLDEMGLLSHGELDRLHEEGLLEETVTSIARHWEEKLAVDGTDLEKRYGGVLPEHETEPRDPAKPDLDPAAEARRVAGMPEDFDLQAEHEKRQTRALADYLATKAEGVERVLTPALTTAVTAAGGSLHGLEHRLKARAAIAAKVERKRETMPLATDDERAQHIADTVRYTAVFPMEKYTASVEKTLGALDAAGFKRSHVGNYWGRDSDYNGLHVGLEGPGGTRAELQLHTDASHRARDGQLAQLRERFRQSDDATERHGLWRDMHAASAKVPKPKGAEHLGHTVAPPVEQSGTAEDGITRREMMEAIALATDREVRVDVHVPPQETHLHATIEQAATEPIIVPPASVEVIVEPPAAVEAPPTPSDRPRRMRAKDDPDRPGERIYELE